MSECGPEQAGGGKSGGEGGGEGRVLHAHSFKLRFAAQREPGRSYVSLVKPLGLPATLTDKFYTCLPEEHGEGGGEAMGERGQRALRRLRNACEGEGRGEVAAPRTESQQYGRWRGGEADCWRRDPRLAHHIRDSAWLKSRLQVLAADDKLKRKL